MAIKLGWVSGTIQDSKRAAAILAIKEKDDVKFDFNGEKYKVTFNEAKEMLPEIVSKALMELERLKFDFNRNFDKLQENLTETMETLLLLK